MSVLSRINLYPIKSLDGVSVPESNLVSPGALEFDRELALYDRRGDWINGKRTPALHRIRAQYDLALRDVELGVVGEPNTTRFNLDADSPRLAQWFTDFVGEPVTIQQNPFGGFPDDIESPGPTVVSTATLVRIAQWYELYVDEVRRRFRANLEIEVDEPFWEDRLVALAGQAVRFKIGDVILEGTNPCQRCPVPSRDSTTGEPLTGFQRSFAERRRDEFPAWAPRERFNHFYRLAVNTRISPSSWARQLRVGDPVAIVGVV